MQVACEHCGRVYDSTLTKSGGFERCPRCNQLNVYLPGGAVHYVIFGDYIIEEKIGRGASAVVVRARNLATNAVAALKIFFSEVDTSNSAYAEFLTEVETATQLEHHNITRIYGGGEYNKIFYIVMEYVDGMNLSEYLSSYGAMPAEDAIAVGIHVCYALDHVWSNHLMVHRDVKPQNIMITTDGNIKLCDFGLVSSHELAVSEEAIMGTPYYVSPEMVKGEEHLDNRSDIYSLGSTLYHVMAGVPPFNYGSIGEVLNARLKEKPQLLSEIATHVPENLSLVIDAMMAIESEDRYMTAYEVAEDLLLVRDGGSPKLIDSNRTYTNE